ncbi:MAG TPA: serine hydrolase [Candidatus Binatia bacterium]|nr:serine hydrolase [Candidatus Binatia bacterium]
MIAGRPRSPSAPALAALLLISLATALHGCGDSSSSGASAQRWPDPDWDVVSPADEGMDPAVLEGARSYAFADGRNTQGVVVVKDGAIVAEWYAPDHGAASLATSWSAAKSFASTLIGIAIDRGDLAGVDVPLSDFYPDWRRDARDAIALRDLMEMRSGLAWNETRDVAAFHISNGDQLAASEARPAARPPGAAFNYSSADSMLLSGVIEQATGRTAGDFAQEVLFGPIGMRADWWIDGGGHTLTYCCIDTTTRDFARFGLLFAREGEWNGHRIVSREWVDEATTPPADLPFYALQWWVDLQGSLIVNGTAVREFTARGLADQNVYVFPELDLVVVRNGIYNRIGTEPVRTGGNYLTTLAPASWDDAAFLAPILRAIDPTATTSALSTAPPEAVSALSATPF